VGLGSELAEYGVVGGIDASSCFPQRPKREGYRPGLTPFHTVLYKRCKEVNTSTLGLKERRVLLEVVNLIKLQNSFILTSDFDLCYTSTDLYIFTQSDTLRLKPILHWVLFF